ncbi:hypothetical protein FB567DRAFT_599660 [Paraphoma chrysanthemicola]|uniref:Uncharacterized protein n=1 Tax=Paraphoma chrysanthemicola TaxID=798071 RepID=A0A8K0QQV4_9PLEO|nr:hypothetical protein FB567DRAFT_599660 [Paraphoma chrysanthemicola]
MVHNDPIHVWTKQQARKGLKGILPSDPDEHDLLGFPGVDGKPPSFYLRKLSLDPDSCTTICESLANDIDKFVGHLDQLVNTLAEDTEKLDRELAHTSFLQLAISGVLDKRGFGKLIWGRQPKAWGCPESKLHVMRPRWRVGKTSKCSTNDEASIRYNLRCWIAARIHEKINAPDLDKTTSSSTARPHATPQPDSIRRGVRTRSSTRISARSSRHQRSGGAAVCTPSERSVQPIPKTMSQPDAMWSRRLRKTRSMRGPNAVIPPPRRSARMRSVL